MSQEFATYKAKIKAVQFSVLLLMVLVTLIGGITLGLGIKCRPVLRIVRPEALHHVKWILDMMIFSSLAQLGTAGLNCFSTCWRMIWLLYLGIGLTSLTVCLGLASIGTSLHLLHAAEDFATEEGINPPWYWVECQGRGGTCHDTMLAYIYYYTMPQIGATSVVIFLQCLGILAMGKMVRVEAERKKSVANYGEWYRDQVLGEAEADEPTSPPPRIPTPPPMKQKSDIEMTPMEKIPSPSVSLGEKKKKSPTFNMNYHTPSSILKVDHGYVQASGGSLDYLDVEARGRRSPPTKDGESSQDEGKKKLGSTPSISFKADVQVHYYDEHDSTEFD